MKLPCLELLHSFAYYLSYFVNYFGLLCNMHTAHHKSDHVLVLLLPSYRQKLKWDRPVMQTIHTQRTSLL